MARDRKRAKQRQQRRGREVGPADVQPVHTGLPSELQHTGELDELDAALAMGARPSGDPADELGAVDELATVDELETFDGQARSDEEGEYPEDEDEPDNGEHAGEADDVARSGFGGGRGTGGETRPVASGGRAPTPGRRRSLGHRAIAFLQASWAELQRVQWPDRRQVAQATAVVLGFVVVAGLYLGAADWVAQKVVNFVL